MYSSSSKLAFPVATARVTRIASDAHGAGCAQSTALGSVHSTVRAWGWFWFATILAALALAGPVRLRATQLVQPALGVYLGPGADGAARVAQFSQWFGRAPDRAIDFFANDTWASLESDAAWTCYSWHPTAAGAVVPQMTFSVPLTVNACPLIDVANGYHDNSFLAVARSLVAYKWGGAVIRIGWEFNGSWMPWAAGRDPSNYVRAYRHVVALMRSVPGANFTFDWCPNWGPSETAPDSVYPGDDVVDIIGMDIYDHYYSAADADPQHRWQTYLTAPYGLNWLVSFSKLHGKALSVPEWGAGEWTVGDGGTGGGDDALFVQNMSQFLKDNNAAYSDYWDINASGYNGTVSDGEHPLAGAALKAAFASVIAPIVGPIIPTVVPPGAIPWIGVGQAATTATVSINFAPPNDGGPPSGYDILYRVSGTGTWLKFAEVTWTGWWTISGLKSGTSYDFEVYAVNSGGAGAASAVLTVPTTGLAVAAVTLPGAIPWLGAGQAATAQTISINFAPPNDGGTPSAYMIQYRVTGQSAWLNFGVVTWTGWQTVSGLSAGTSYDFQVYASNAAGRGAASGVFTAATTAQ